MNAISVQSLEPPRPRWLPGAAIRPAVRARTTRDKCRHSSISSLATVLLPKLRGASGSPSLRDTDRFLPSPGTACRPATPRKSLYVEGSEGYLFPGKSGIAVKDFVDGC